MDNLEEMDKFQEMCNLPRLNKEDIENRNRPITSNGKTNKQKKTSQHSKVQDQMVSQVNSAKHFFFFYIFIGV